MNWLLVFYPLLLTVFSSLGLGLFAFKLVGIGRHDVPTVLRHLQAYFLGQCLLAALLLLLGIGRIFTIPVLLCLFIPTALFGAISCCRDIDELKAAKERLSLAWREVSLPWKMASLSVVALLLAGWFGMGGDMGGDAIAFYGAVAKLTAADHSLTPLPGYEDFTGIGIMIEMIHAALMSLGMPDVSFRMYSWLNMIPTTLMLFALCRQAGISRRGGTIAASIMITSNAGLLLLDTGKVDLFPVGTSFAAFSCALCAWQAGKSWRWLLLSGTILGATCVIKMSYCVAIAPAVAMLAVWPQFIFCLDALRVQRLREAMHALGKCLLSGIPFMIGFTLTIIPHAAKNIVFFGNPFGLTLDSPIFWNLYSTSTTIRILASYPFALVYGKYWAQTGNLSPLVIAFFPLLFLMPRPASWSASKVGALGFASLVGMLCWMAIYPSSFMPRYFLTTLFALGIPLAAGAALYSRKSALLNLAIPMAIIVNVATVAFRGEIPFFNLQCINYAFDYPFEHLEKIGFSYYNAHIAVNERAKPGDRVYLSYYRFWLRPDLLRNASTVSERNHIPGDVWTRIKEGGFRFIQVDNGSFLSKADVEKAPQGVILRCIYNDQDIQEYEVEFNSDFSPATEKNPQGR